jgi:hypothetical protein
VWKVFSFCIVATIEAIVAVGGSAMFAAMSDAMTATMIAAIIAAMAAIL